MKLNFKQTNPSLVDPLHGVPNKNSRRYKKIWLEIYGESAYTWKLSRYVKPYDGEFMFSYYRMDEQLGELHYADVLSYINDVQWFDFDYEPQNADYLIINYQYRLSQTPAKYRPADVPQFMAFKYKSGEWVYERYFDEVLEDITEGILYVEK